MKVYLIGVGMGNPETLTVRALEAIRECPVLVGARRLLEPWAENHQCVPLITAADIAEFIGKTPEGPVAVLLSGDTGFYSGAKNLWPLLGSYEVETVPGISSLTYFCARIQTTWQDASWSAPTAGPTTWRGRSRKTPRPSPSPAGPPGWRTCAGSWWSGAWERFGSPWGSG